METLIANNVEKMQNDLTAYIERKRSRNEEQINAIGNDCRLIYDYLVPSNKLEFWRNMDLNGDTPGDIKLGFGERQADKPPKLFTLHDNALTQTAAKFGIPGTYLKELFKGSRAWEKDLARTILQEHAAHAKQEKFLVRAIGNEVRGILSDSYKRINSIIIYTTFLVAAKETGAVVVDAHYDGLTGFLEVLQPNVIAVPTEKNGIQYICFGVQLRNSDFGSSALEMRAFNFIVRCKNGWVTQSILRNIHLGARLPDNLELSEMTYKLDTETKASLVKDTIGQLMNPEKVYKYSIMLQEASKIEIDLDREIKLLPQIGVHDYETEALKKIFMENSPVNNVEGENTLFKLTQGLSAVARDSNENRKRELAEITGKLFERAGLN